MNDFTTTIADVVVRSIVVDAVPISVAPITIDVIAVSGGMTLIDNISDTTSLELPAAENIGGHRIVGIDPNGKAMIASSDLAWCQHTVKGISVQAAATGADILIRTQGLIEEPSWNWIPGNPVFLSSTGLPTQAAPETGFIVQVGVAFSSTRIFVFIRPSIILEN